MIITLSNTKISASINTIGAELIQLEKDNKNYIWTVDEAFWNKTSPILFPIVGRLKNDSYSINGKSYELPRHGFARNFEFEVEHQTESSAIFILTDNAETLKNYPFPFELRLQYELIENSLKISYSVFNKSQEIMPFSIGAHPAFAIEDSFSDYSLQFIEAEEFVSYELENEQFSNSFRKINSENGQINLDYSLFEKDALVLKHLKSDKLTLLKGNQPYLSVEFEGFPFLGIWTKPNAPFLCIEPWCGLADNINHNGDIYEKEGIQLLENKSNFQRKIVINLL
ncbi:aldose 1-epimerase family protein [Flavobacterium sp.]|uniref:aldose 1-epimerase family protein n=1 Tax=Flavobacterium sp. TaxID=239 RepID=UPI0008C35A1C|nr:aldose 1-epimerase family protein [Flavobacterium sp.]OGS63002.1 MAG: aldose epimerase [Flavobacteria bacterium GWF1_32_7]HBD25894.1 aldose epimerase [Flavobacterium sp.]